MKIDLPELSLVVLVGPTGSGKSTFARDRFGPYEVVSSDFCRGVVADDENDQSATAEAFELLHEILRKRLALGKLTVVDATNVRPEDRRPLVRIAREFHVLPVAIVFDLPESVCRQRNEARPDRSFGPGVIRRQRAALRQSRRGLKREGFRYLYTFKNEEEVAAATIERQSLWNNRKTEHGPFDIIGDVHGCFDELVELLEKLGYRIEQREDTETAPTYCVTPPAGRKAVFVGDLVDRGPKIPAVLRLVMDMVEAGVADCVPGNHDDKLKRALRGNKVQITHGLADSLEQLEAEPEDFRWRAHDFLDSLISHHVYDNGRLVVAHAGLKEEMQGRGSGKVREFCLYGETTGETDEFGLPVRHNWAAEYRGQAMVIYGHTPVPEPQWLNGTINIDTGCVFGGGLTALRYPEQELVSVPGRETYAEPVRPFLPAQEEASDLTAQQELEDVLDLEDVFGKRIIDTRLHKQITIREENASAALEVISRFAVHPKWLIYLPPTMSPSETSQRPNYLEHPEDAFAYYRSRGVERVVCQQKHMGSRAVVVLARSEEAARQRFGVTEEEVGVIYTRTGRRFFNEPAMEQAMLSRLGQALERSGLWGELDTDWLCLDCELMPWSAKAEDLLRHQYAAVGSAGRFALAEARAAVQQAADRLDDAGELLAEVEQRQQMLDGYVQAYRHYCWDVESLEDLQLAPFHLLASEGAVHAERDHLWHMAMARQLDEADGQVIVQTDYREVDLEEPASVAATLDWWEASTAIGGEGMVVKPLDFIARGKRGLLQPAVKCRGREYLRIIYGPEYTRPEYLDRLRKRGLGRKRSLALREFALGVEALERFVRREPLRRVHECAFAVLALESEPVDPRL